MTKLIIFDLDGTLLDTIHDLAASTNHLLALRGYPTHETETYLRLVGHGITDLITRALPESSRTTEIIQSVKEEQRVYYRAHMADLTRPFPGVEETLRELIKAGGTLAVVTNKPQLPSAGLMQKFFPEIPFFSVVGQVDGHPQKPDPTSVNKIIADFGCAKEEVLYCGDSDVDMQTANRAGVFAVGVLWGYRPKEELLASGAARLISSPQELLDLIKERE